MGEFFPPIAENPANVSIRSGSTQRLIPPCNQIVGNATIQNTGTANIGHGPRNGFTFIVPVTHIVLATSILQPNNGVGENNPANVDDAETNHSVYEAYLEQGGVNRGAFIWGLVGNNPQYTKALIWTDRFTQAVAANEEVFIRSLLLANTSHPAGSNRALRTLKRLTGRWDRQGGNDVVDAAGATAHRTGTGGALSAQDRESPFVFGWTTSARRTAEITGDSIAYGGNGFGATSISKGGAASYIEIALWQSGTNPWIWFNSSEPGASWFNRYPSTVLPTVSQTRFQPGGYVVRESITSQIDFDAEFCGFGTNEFSHASSGFVRENYILALLEIAERKIRTNIGRKRETYFCLGPVQVATPMPSIALAEAAYMDAQVPSLNTIGDIGAGGVTQLRRDIIVRLTALCKKLGSSYVIDATASVQGLNTRGELVFKKGAGGELLVDTTGPLPDGDGTHPNELARNMMATNMQTAILSGVATTRPPAGLLVKNPAL